MRGIENTILWLYMATCAAFCGFCAERPYELVQSGRTHDVQPATCAMVSADGWKIETERAVASINTSVEHPLFSEDCIGLVYHAAGKDPVVALRPRQPVEVAPFDTLTLWVFGNNVKIFGNLNPTPQVDIRAEFVTPSGEKWDVAVGRVQHLEWHQYYIPVTGVARELAGQGGRFLGFVITGGKNTTDRQLFFSSFATFREKLPSYEWTPRRKRGVVVFPNAPQGFNTGEGRLPFPTVESTVVPPAKEDPEIEFRIPADSTRWDELAVRYRKGEWIPLAKGGGLFPATKDAKVRFHRLYNSIVADVEAPAGVEEVRFGESGFAGEVKRVVFPFWTYHEIEREARPGVIAACVQGEPFFFAATWDWTQSGGSEPFADVPKPGGQISNGGVRYYAKSDGKLNPCRERFVWSVARTCEDVFPFIPNPPSPYRAIMAERVWRGLQAKDRRINANYLDGLRRQGAVKLAIADSQEMWRDDFESYTFRTNAAARKGGDTGQRAYTRKLIDEFGFLYGPYLGWTDLTTMNAWWDPLQVMRNRDGSLMTGWWRCYSPKVMHALRGCEELAPVVQSKFGFNCAYCDVHTHQKPWKRTDYDARCPGAAECATTFYGYGELLLRLREIIGGPVYSEGSMHWMYAGLVDGNYGQDKFYRFDENPWLVDFDLRRIHPLECDFGMGSPPNFFWRANVDPKSKTAIDRFLAATIAFGHTGFLLTYNNAAVRRSYSLIQPIAAYYAKAEVEEIRYVDAEGRLWPLSEAIFNGAAMRSQIATRYSDGTVTIVNGNNAEMLRLKGGKLQLELPPNSFWCRSGDGRVVIDSTKQEGEK